MRYNSGVRERRSIRLRGYDYSQPGAYFVTICVAGRACLFGDVVGGTMARNDAGAMIEGWWRKLPQKFPSCEADTFVVMPNHVHGVIVIRDAPVGADPRVRPVYGARPYGHSASRPSLPRIVHWFKTMTTNAYIRGVEGLSWASFEGRLWQRGYYEHIVRGDEDLARIRRYIEDNPANWPDDPDNPANRG